jgi:hypothetical protein
MKNLLTTIVLMFTFTMNSQVIKYPIDTVYTFEYPAHMDLEIAQTWNKTKPTGSGFYLDSADRYWVIDTTNLTITIYNESFRIIKYVNNTEEFIIDYCQEDDTDVTRTMWFMVNEFGELMMLYTIQRVNEEDPIPNTGGWSVIKQEGGQ